MRKIMRNKKYIWCMLAVFSLLILVLGNGTMNVKAEVFTGTDGQNLTWRLEDGVLTISGKGDMYDFGHKSFEIFEWEINCDILPFGCGRTYWQDCEDKIKKVVVEEGITSIAPHVFEHLNNVESIQLPSTLKSIGHAAFANSDIKSITIPDSVTSIDVAAFYECKSLKKVKLPSNLEEIQNRTFYGCTALKNISIPKKVKYIRSAAFQYCSSLKEINIPKKMQIIESRAFDGCTKLKKLKGTGKSQLEVIGTNAFLGCKIAKFTIPASVEEIFTDAMQDCQEIQVDKKNKKYCSQKGVLFSKNKKTLYCYPAQKKGKSYKIPKGVKTIGVDAFKDNDNVKTIVMPDSVTLIDNGAFSYMEKLKTVRFSKKLKKIRGWAFHAASLENLQLPDSLEYIGSNAFTIEKGDIVIPKNVKTMGEDVFHCLKRKQKIIVKTEKLRNKTGRIFQINSYNTKNIKIKVILPLSKKEEYKKIFTKKTYGKEFRFIYE